ncbi:MAG: hypothetical protein V4619_06735 [Bacteroidota bacterium]
MVIKLNHALFAATILLLCSCKTYYIPVDSFRQQFKGLERSKYVTTQTPLGSKQSYDTYPIAFIKCIDKNGSETALKNGPSIEIRFTTNDNKKTVFYFDLMSIYQDTVLGVKSRFVPNIKEKISLTNVKSIEVQDGKKKFKYL